mgnify:CR=1 FL=1
MQMTKAHKKKKTLFQKIEPVLYLAPAFLLLSTFTYYPFLKTVTESFFRLNAMGEVRGFVGFENFRAVLHNAKFIQSIGNTLKFVVFSVPFSVGVAFVLAMIASKKRPISPVYETFFSLPMAMSMSVSAMIFELMFSPTLGIVNAVTGLDIKWLNDKNTALWVIIVIQVWMNLGYNFLFILSAIRGVSEDLLESADLEGANAFQKGVRIIMPLVSPTLFFLLCNSLAKMIMMSGLSLVLTKGGPQGSTETMISFMYKQATENGNYNAAYPSALIAFVITMVATIITFTYEKKGVNYDV